MRLLYDSVTAGGIINYFIFLERNHTIYKIYFTDVYAFRLSDSTSGNMQMTCFLPLPLSSPWLHLLFCLPSFIAQRLIETLLLLLSKLLLKEH